jgi:hypothetical protein
MGVEVFVNQWTKFAVDWNTEKDAPHVEFAQFECNSLEHKYYANDATHQQKV